MDTRLEQMDQLLDYIRANLRNIRSTWGESSAQYRSAVEIMERALIDNATRMRLDDWRMKELMDKMDKLTVEP